MKRLFAGILAPTLLVGALGAGAALTVATNQAGAAVRSHDTMAAKSWHGTVEKVNAPMGTTDSFTLKVGKDVYTVHWNDMTHWVMGTKKDLKAGAMVSVTGTVVQMTISATKLDL